MIRDMRLLFGAALVTSVLVTGCSKQNDAAASPEAGAQQPNSALPEGHPQVPATATMPGLKGTVLETMDSGGYTYAKIAVGGQEIWAAGPTTALAVGDTVSVSTSMAMPNFTSKTLNRTFEKLYFTEAFVKPGQSAPAAVAGATGAAGT